MRQETDPFLSPNDRQTQNYKYSQVPKTMSEDSSDDLEAAEDVGLMNQRPNRRRRLVRMTSSDSLASYSGCCPRYCMLYVTCLLLGFILLIGLRDQLLLCPRYRLPVFSVFFLFLVPGHGCI